MGSVDDGRTYGLNHNTSPQARVVILSHDIARAQSPPALELALRPSGLRQGTWMMKGDDTFDAHVMDGR